MTIVSISDLKARLSQYLRIVRNGGEVQILDRGVPVARLVGIQGIESEGRWRRLVGAGVLRPGTGDTTRLLAESPLALPGAGLSEALEEERGDRV